jgi:hypothetical protein
MAKGRKHSNVEFIKRLSKILELSGGEFARRIGKKAPNVTNYLSGKSVPGDHALRSALRHAFEWEVISLVEIKPVKEHANSLPHEPGIYCLYDSSGGVIYVGQAKDLKQEVAQTLQRDMNFPVRLGPKLSLKAYRKYKTVAAYLSAYEVQSPRMRHNLEALLLRSFPNQSHNNKMGNFK